MSSKTPSDNFQYGQLYRSEDKIYPREVKGRFARLRRIAMFVLLGMFYGGPWLTWGGRRAGVRLYCSIYRNESSTYSA